MGMGIKNSSSRVSRILSYIAGSHSCSIMAIRITQPLSRQQIIDSMLKQIQQQRVADIISSYDYKLKQKSKKRRSKA